MSAPNKIDRRKVLSFFTWRNKEARFFLLAIGCFAVASWTTFIGVAMGLRHVGNAWGPPLITAIGFAILGCAAPVFRNALRAELPLLELHSELKRVKNLDFASLLVRSFHEIGTDLNKLLHFGQTGLITPDPNQPSSGEKNLIDILDGKYMILYGKHENNKFIKCLFAERTIEVEYSPILVAILFITRSALIVYYASLDVIEGEITQEEVKRILLKDVAGVTTEPVSRRMHRTGNERLFQEYERIVRNRRSNELMSVEHLIRVARNDGDDLFLPAGDPGYGSSIRRIREKRETLEARLASIADAISTKIREAKEALESEAGRN